MIDLILGEAREELYEMEHKIKEGIVRQPTMVITSPPYNVGVNYGVWNDDMPQEEYWKFTQEWLQVAYRLLPDGGRIAVNCPNTGNSPKHKKGEGFIPVVANMTQAIINAGFTLRETITWVKTNSDQIEDIDKNFCGNNTAWGSWLSPSNLYCRSFSEFILVAHKGAPRLQHKGTTDLTKEEFLLWTRNVWLMRTVHDKNHPAPFPEELPKRLMKLYTYPGDTILDPFVGRGTTMVACVNNNRNGIGIEINPEYLALTEVNVQLATTAKEVANGR